MSLVLSRNCDPPAAEGESDLQSDVHRCTALQAGLYQVHSHGPAGGQGNPHKGCSLMQERNRTQAQEKRRYGCCLIHALRANTERCLAAEGAVVCHVWQGWDLRGSVFRMWEGERDLSAILDGKDSVRCPRCVCMLPLFSLSWQLSNNQQRRWALVQVACFGTSCC